MNDTRTDGNGGEIHFDGDLLVKALRYHLDESGMAEHEILNNLPAGGFSARISREIWANLDDDQRLSWLLQASLRAGVTSTKAVGLAKSGH